ncbi:hypothetical protein QBC37DRAFT_411652 [Rhypophila decipiens]|uniref:RNA polymerase II transcription factor B subunit 3 n=1 Tax=Rhypophila decipiens TaxID=261697 RepID=A0AAN6YHZ8_9PEZI|nr:hypothetical protein QBC37DRAFT_411652 [Rhypophila decipiens]
MSRRPGAGYYTATAAKPGGGMPLIDKNDMCPVCKMMRYLNPDMEFLINPECYHSMCTGCVNRLFNDGPNQCPYAGCHKTLRRKGFKSAFFGDLAVEREVDLRRRVNSVFNQVEDDFETLRDYNNYLQMVEDLTFDLVNGTETKRREAEAQLLQWEMDHKPDIERNRKAGREAEEQTRRRLQAEQELARQRRIAAIQEQEEEKLALVRNREAVLDSMATGGQRVQLKKRGGVKAADITTAAAASAGSSLLPGSLDVGKLSIRGLKEKKKTAAPEGPYDPFGGYDFVPSRYKVHSGLGHPLLERFEHDRAHVTGGYSLEEFTARAMFEAFAGLGVFIEDEKEVGIGLSAGEVTGMAAGIAATGHVMDPR